VSLRLFQSSDGFGETLLVVISVAYGEVGFGGAGLNRSGVTQPDGLLSKLYSCVVVLLVGLGLRFIEEPLDVRVRRLSL